MHDDNMPRRRYVASDELRDDVRNILADYVRDEAQYVDCPLTDARMHVSNDGHGSSIVVRTSTGQTFRIIVTEVA